MLVWLFWQINIPLTPFAFTAPITVKEKTIKRGGTLIYTVTRCKNIDGASTVSRVLIDSIVYNLPEVSSNLPAGCKVNEIFLEIPKVIPAGVYKLRTTATYKINPFRTFSATAETETFTIVE